MGGGRGRLRRLDDAVLPTLRRVAERVVAPARALRGWEGSPRRGRLVRGLRAHPGRVAAAAGLVVVSAGAVHAQRYQADDVPAATSAEEVGPRTGADVERYIEGRHEVLGRFAPDEQVRAIVSFDGVVALDELPLPGEVEVEVLQLVVPAQEREPRQLDLAAVEDPEAAVAALLEQERAELEVEIDELESTLSEDLGDPAFEADFEERLEELEEARQALDGDVDVVFAAVLVAEAEVLRTLLDDPQVRVVDPAGPAAETADARFHGLVPSDMDRVRAGRPL